MDQFDRVASWPIREALLSFLERLKVEAREKHRMQLDWFAHGRLAKAPTTPELLNDG